MPAFHQVRVSKKGREADAIEGLLILTFTSAKQADEFAWQQRRAGHDVEVNHFKLFRTADEAQETLDIFFR